MSRKSIHQQKGMALLIVLLLMLSLSVTALAVIETMRLSTARMVAGEERDQALWYLQSVELLAVTTLERQWQARPAVDTADEAWLEKDILIPIDEGAMVLRFDDLSTCLNVNALVQREDHQLVADKIAARDMQHALQAMGVGRNESQSFTNVVTDWIDSDLNQRSAGAEDSFYTRLDQPFRTSGLLMAAVSEVRSLSGISPDLYNGLKRSLCALPDMKQPMINVNLLSEDDYPLLQAVLDGIMNREEVLNLIARRPEGGYDSIDAFFAQSLFEGKEISAEARQRFGVWSEYLTLTTEIRYGSAYVQAHSLVHVDDGGTVTIISREFGPIL